MDYIELNIPVADAAQSELLVAELGELPFDSFTEQAGVLKAYIPAPQLPDCKEVVDDILSQYEVSCARFIAIEAQNWNALWESQFEPVDVDGRVVIRAPFHAPSEVEMEVVIMPKMSFGTGHHATTWLMAAEMMDREWAGRKVLDMGAGTGVLAILAAKLGASEVDAVDIDEWAWRNSMENIEANGVTVRTQMGNVETIRGRQYDAILANINRNILLTDMPAYVEALRTGGELLVSGILEADIPAILHRANELNLHNVSQRLRDGWAVLGFELR